MIRLFFDTVQGRVRRTDRGLLLPLILLMLTSLLIFSANSFAQIPKLSIAKLAVTDSIKVEGQNVTSFFTTLSDSNTTNTSTYGDSTISQQKLTQSLIDVINAAGGGSITNNPDEVTITVSGGLLGVKASSLTTSFLDGSHTFDFASGLTSTDIGVNTSSPQSLVDIQGNAGAAGILTLATKELTVVDGDELGRINFNAPLESSGSDAILPAAAIWAEADFTFGAASNRGELVFGTSETSVPVERMRLTSDGKLGIGVASPTEELEIATATHVTVVLNAAQAAQIQIDRGVTTRDAQVIFLTAGAPDWYMGLPDSDLSGDGTEFYISDTNNGVDPRIWIETSGNVGIDNNNPATKLHVVGNITLGDSTTGDVDGIIYFADDASVTAESFMWNDGNDQFEFTDDISVTGNVVVSGTVDGKDIATNAAMLNEAETITAGWTFNAFGSGDFIADEYDVEVGTNDTAAVMKVGNLEFGTSDDRTLGASLTAGGAVFLNVKAAPDGIGEFFFTSYTGDIRFAIPSSGVGLGTYNPRSMIIAGPSVMKDSTMRGVYWGFNRIYMDTGNNGADLGVQNVAQIGDSLFVNTNITIGGNQFTVQADSTLINPAFIVTTGSVTGEHLKTTDDVEVTDDVLLADGSVIGITGNEVITFAAAGSINITGATHDVDGAFTASTVVSDGVVTATTTVSGEHVASTDDADIVDNITVGDMIIDEAAGVIDFSGATSATIITSGSNIDLTLTPNGTGNIVMSDMVIFATASITLGGPTNNVDVAGVNVLFMDTNGNNVTIGGFIGGVSGQVLQVVVVDATNNSILEHNEGTGNQDVFLSGGADETRTASYGGWTLVCNGTSWFEVGQ